MDDSRICRFCGRKFYSSTNRHRHEVGFHNMKDDEEEVYPMSESAQSSPERRTNSPEAWPKPQSESSVRSDDNQEVEDVEEREDEEDGEEDVWDELIQETCENVPAPEGVTSVDGLFHHEGFIHHFLVTLFELLDRRMRFANQMEEDEEIYLKLQDTANHYQERGYKEDEAFEVAWNKRRYLLKKMLKDRANIFEQEYFGEEEEESETMPFSE